MKKKFLAQWLPSVVFGVLSLIFAVVYTCIQTERVYTVYLQLLFGIFAPLVFPLLGLITKKNYPPVLSVILGLLVFWGIHLGKAANLYAYIPHYDKVLHTNFGLLGAAMFYALLLRWGGEKLNPAGMIITVIAATLGMGAVWEFIEYFCGMLVNEDPQMVWGFVNQIIAAGGEHVVNPISDTIQDLIVTVLGSCVFVILYLADMCFGGKVTKKLFI